MKKESMFFDIHMHAFNLSHAGLLAFINRAVLNSNLTLNDIYDKKILRIIGAFIKPKLSKFRKHPLSVFKKKQKHGDSFARFVNTLSIFENDIARQFQYLELDYLLMSGNNDLQALIKELKEPVNYREFSKNLKNEWENTGKNILIAGKEFKKVVLAPLMMDFNNKGFTGLDKEKIHYYLPPRKQIMDQLVDLFTGIKQYYDFSDIQLFEIFPFLAINTENLEFGNESTRYYKKNVERHIKSIL